MSPGKKRRILLSYFIPFLLPLIANERAMNRKLDRYKETKAADDTVEFLDILFEYVPPLGRKSLFKDVVRCFDDEDLRQLVERIEFGLLRPMLSPRLEMVESSEMSIRDNCVSRDGNRCAITNILAPPWYWGLSWKSTGTPLSAARIIPLDMVMDMKLGVLRPQPQSLDMDERYRHGKVWDILQRYFRYHVPSLHSDYLSHYSSLPVPDIFEFEKEQNRLVMAAVLRREFEMFHFVLEATHTLNHYYFKGFSELPSYLMVFVPRDRIVRLKNHDSRYLLPSPILLSIHAAIGNLLHESSRGEKIQQLKEDLSRSRHGPARVGSSKIEDIFSLSKLSRLIPYDEG
ncbi:hypothetical protein ASPVEDRAFT_24256 [Aspergillus versicolor CBS 583.65]|uniref:HNH nuclease domain-containing protein n=1 Tax=Aspergillus versicolor CBS 583.65 TaxID=1036611 RepID=A0A1L9P712_ASPVE|nr:uncharacterized protein ASPVEDRAFT_24256 [Aspergillus versicolor CBS 583.65]OJI97288.1 hypothetical protein ASPVEDRAFT_24256 [Aspergillus versicolor CBS 583.65]